MCRPVKHVCYVQVFRRVPLNFNVPSNMSKVELTQGYAALLLTALSNLCYYVEVNDGVQETDVTKYVICLLYTSPSPRD